MQQTFYKNLTDVDFFKAIKPLPGAFPSSVNWTLTQPLYLSNKLKKSRGYFFSSMPNLCGAYTTSALALRGLPSTQNRLT